MDKPLDNPNTHRKERLSMGIAFDVTQIKNPAVREQAIRLAEAARAKPGIQITADGIRDNRTPEAGKTQAAQPKAQAKGRGQPNKTEQEFNRLYLRGEGRYEAITFRLPGGSRYTPDWYLPPTTVAEVKGAYRFGSHGRALTAWREARAQFPAFRFVWARKGEDGWEVEGLDFAQAATQGEVVS